MRIIGIDPGLEGGIAIISEDGLDVMPMPVNINQKGREIDERGLADLFMSVRVAGQPHAFLEKIHSMPKQGVRSTFNFGLGWGQVRGILAGLGIPYQLVRPQEWQKEMMIGYAPGSENQIVSQLWPTVDFKKSIRCKNLHSGMVDAALIAEYGRRKLRD